MTTHRDLGSPRLLRHFDQIADVRLLREIVRHLFTESTDYIFLFDLEGRMIEVNTAACDQLEYSEGDVLTMNIFSDIMASTSPANIEQLCKALGVGQNVSLEGSMRHRNGGASTMCLTVSLLGEGAEALYLCSARAPKNKSARKSIHKDALRDPTTGLLTRTFFYEELHQLDAERHLPLSVIRGDLNGMKLINSAFGQIVGDKLLKAATRVLRKHSRSSDILVRWEYDEFLLLLPGTREDDAASIVERIEDAFRHTKVRELPVPPSISMGYSAKTHRWQDFENVLVDAEEEMREHQLSEGRKIRTKLLSWLQKHLDEHTPETEEHIASMQRIAHILGELLHLPPDEMGRLDLAVRLHDIGKAAISRHLLNKTAPITDEDMENLRRHAEIGGKIAEAATPETAEVAPLILSHHERWDGAGYPSGLVDENIPLISRIISVADAFDVMTRGTPYKNPISSEKALEELKRMSGVQFDPTLVSLFTEHSEKILMNTGGSALPVRRK